MEKAASLIILACLSFAFPTVIFPCFGTGDVKIQLCMVIDGSASVSNADWVIIKQAIAKAVNETVPHDGSCELAIVQFGYSWGEGYAKIEIPPTAIGGSNYGTVASQALSMPKGDGNTPMAHGIYLGWKALRTSPNFAVATRHAINLATDGQPNVRNNNASIDLDGSGYGPNAWDDVIAVVDSAASEGLSELDMEGIGITSNTTRDWFKGWAVHPQPGVLAPPFVKPGWIRMVADSAEFAGTIGQKMQVMIVEGTDVWVPPAEMALFAGLMSVGLTSVVSSLASAVSNPENFPSTEVAQKINSVFPETMKKWLHEFISSKRKLVIGQHQGHSFVLTKREILSYTIALSVLTLAFSYAKSSTLNQILPLIPTVLATSIIVEFAKNFIIETIARSQGVWTEHRLWYFGVATFLFSTLAFKVPFSSPSRLTHHSPRFTKRSLGLVSSASILTALAFAAVFYILFTRGLTVIGNIGLIMCLTMAFFDTLPIQPINGKDIYNWSKVLWIALFVSTLALYTLCLFLL